MRDPQQRRRRWAGGATPLLLALALAGCGGGDAGDQTATADSAAISASKNAPADSASCPPPPMATNAVLKGTWAGLLGWLNSEGVTFPDTTGNVAEDSVPLCVNGCAPTRVKLQSTAQTYCLTGQQAAASQQRILGMMVLIDSFPGKQPIPPIPAGDTIFLFARGNPGVQSPATLAYRRGVNVAQFPGSAGWNFVFCNDGMVNPGPAARWRTDVDSQAARTAGGGGAADGQGDPSGGGPGGGTYGWLACANGCCQFYTPPPTAGGPDDSVPPPPFCTPRNP
jgi:hypothetical protein